MSAFHCGISVHVLPVRCVARGPCSGFTLLELLIAMSVFAVMTAVAYGGLRTVLESKQVLDARFQALAELQSAFSLLRRDIEQAVTRSVRAEAGTPLPPLMGHSGDGEILAITRAGWSNPRGMRRSTLQRVAYRWQGNTLHRVSWDVLDRTPEADSVDIKLLEGVEAVRLRFLDQSRDWHSVWPPEETGGTGLPSAVELALKLRDRGELLRLFCLPACGHMEERGSG